MTIDDKLDIIAQTPFILNELVGEIPLDLLKVRRITGKWCIHEHVCHLFEAQEMMRERFKTFKAVKNPTFTHYLPGSNVETDKLLDMDMKQALLGFSEERMELVKFLKTFNAGDWYNAGKHPEYTSYTPFIFLRHIMMHDHLHMYRIEELWLTSDQYLRN